MLELGLVKDRVNNLGLVGVVLGQAKPSQATRVKRTVTIPVGISCFFAVQYGWVWVILFPATGLSSSSKPARVSSTPTVVPVDEKITAQRVTASFEWKYVLGFIFHVCPGRVDHFRGGEPVDVVGWLAQEFRVKLDRDFFFTAFVKSNLDLGETKTILFQIFTAAKKANMNKLKRYFVHLDKKNISWTEHRIPQIKGAVSATPLFLGTTN